MSLVVEQAVGQWPTQLFVEEHATRLSAGGVADEWVTQMLPQSDACRGHDEAAIVVDSAAIGGADGQRDPAAQAATAQLHVTRGPSPGR